MPIYEYVCQSCTHRFEVKQKLTDDPVGSCIRCGHPVTKVISAPAIMFKGTGWYVTDYSDKLKAPGSADTAGSNGQKDQKAPSPTAAGDAAPATSPASSTSSPSSNGASSPSSSSST